MNEKIKVIYAIVAGEYSDYRVLAVANDEATAQVWAKALADDEDGWKRDARVEEMLFIPAGLQPYKNREVSVSQDWWDDGTEGDLRTHSEESYPIASLYGQVPIRPAVRFVRAPCHHGKGGRIEIRGQDEASVMKVYSEQKAGWKISPKTFKEQELPGGFEAE